MAVSGTEAKEQDVALGALDALSEATTSSIEGLNEVNEQFTVAKRRRRVGWSWQRIVSSTDLPSALSAVARTTADLGRASGEFRRSLAQVLRGEGIRLADIGHYLAVSRQRVGALIRSRRTESDDRASLPPDDR
jgi:hypothetical protein